MLAIDFIQIEKSLEKYLSIENKMKNMQLRLEEISIEYDEQAVLRNRLNKQKEQLAESIEQIQQMIEALRKIASFYGLCENKCLDYLEEVKSVNSKIQICKIEIPKDIFSLLC